MDFFTVPTITFSSLYCFFVISHDRRRILHFNITKHPTSSWIIQQLREAFPFGSAPEVSHLDRDAKYGLEVPAAVRSLRANPSPHFVRKSLVEWSRRALGRSCRRDLLDHASSQLTNAPETAGSLSIFTTTTRTAHLGLGKGTPDGRPRTIASGRVLSHVRLGGLHHRVRSGRSIRTNVGSRKLRVPPSFIYTGTPRGSPVGENLGVRG